MTTPIFVDGKPVYNVTPSGALRKRVRTNHFLSKPPALAADVAVIRQAQDLGADRCEFIHAETGDVYSAPLAWLAEHGIYLNRRFGAQKALPLEYWSKNGREPAKRPRAIVEAEPKPEPEAVQLGLFGGAA